MANCEILDLKNKEIVKDLGQFRRAGQMSSMPEALLGQYLKRI